jgi:hypothetical protein
MPESQRNALWLDNIKGLWIGWRNEPSIFLKLASKDFFIEENFNLKELKELIKKLQKAHTFLANTLNKPTG